MGPIIVIAASVGGLDPLRQIVSALPAPCLAAVFIVSHVGPHPSILPEILGMESHLPVSRGEDGEPFEAGHVYVAPSDAHMYLDRGMIRLDHGAKIHHTRPAADPLFVSAAENYGARVVGIVLSGYDGDGAEGLRVVKERGGVTLVQRPEDAEQPPMPWTAMLVDHPDGILPANEIAERMAALCSRSAEG